MKKSLLISFPVILLLCVSYCFYENVQKTTHPQDSSKSDDMATFGDKKVKSFQFTDDTKMPFNPYSVRQDTIGDRTEDDAKRLFDTRYDHIERRGVTGALALYGTPKAVGYIMTYLSQQEKLLPEEARDLDKMIAALNYFNDDRDYLLQVHFHQGSTRIGPIEANILGGIQSLVWSGSEEGMQFSQELLSRITEKYKGTEYGDYFVKEIRKTIDDYSTPYSREYMEMKRDWFMNGRRTREYKIVDETIKQLEKLEMERKAQREENKRRIEQSKEHPK